jgi:hypothetical protein
VIYWSIQMNLVATGAEFRRLGPHKGLQKYPAMRLRIQADDIVMEPSHDRVLAGGHCMQRRIFQREVSLAHRAFHRSNRMAHHAAQAGARFRAVDNLLDWGIEKAAVKQSGIMSSGAPL